VRESADVLDERHETDAQHPRRQGLTARLGDARREECVDPLRQAAEKALDRLDVERADLDDRTELRTRVDLRHGQLVDRVLDRLDSQLFAGEKEQEVGPRDGREDLGNLFLVLLEPGIRHPEEEVAVLARDDAVPEQREDDLLGDIQPVGADLAALVIQEDLRARPE